MGQSLYWYFSELQAGILGFIICIPKGIAGIGFVPFLPALLQ